MRIAQKAIEAQVYQEIMQLAKSHAHTKPRVNQRRKCKEHFTC